LEENLYKNFPYYKINDLDANQNHQFNNLFHAIECLKYHFTVSIFVASLYAAHERLSAIYLYLKVKIARGSWRKVRKKSGLFSRMRKSNLTQQDKISTSIDKG
jgi:hypothetical protein